MIEALECAIIDSSVLISYKEGDLNAKKLLHSAIDSKIAITISSYSLFVLSKSEDFDRKSEIGFMSLLKFLDTVSLDTEIAMKAGYLYRSESAKTNSYRQVDLFNMSDPNLHLIEDSITCSISESMGYTVISNRDNSLDYLNVEWILLAQL